jgi:hypothetical protein
MPLMPQIPSFSTLLMDSLTVLWNYFNILLKYITTEVLKEGFMAYLATPIVCCCVKQIQLNQNKTSNLYSVYITGIFSIQKYK